MTDVRSDLTTEFDVPTTALLLSDDEKPGDWEEMTLEERFSYIQELREDE